MSALEQAKELRQAWHRQKMPGRHPPSGGDAILLVQRDQILTDIIAYCEQRESLCRHHVAALTLRDEDIEKQRAELERLRGLLAGDDVR